MAPLDLPPYHPQCYSNFVTIRLRVPPSGCIICPGTSWMQSKLASNSHHCGMSIFSDIHVTSTHDDYVIVVYFQYFEVCNEFIKECIYYHLWIEKIELQDHHGSGLACYCETDHLERSCLQWRQDDLVVQATRDNSCDTSMVDSLVSMLLIYGWHYPFGV